MRNLANQNRRMAKVFSVGRSYEGREQRAIEVIMNTIFYGFL